jgi:hypothetical protein
LPREDGEDRDAVSILDKIPEARRHPIDGDLANFGMWHAGRFDQVLNRLPVFKCTG